MIHVNERGVPLVPEHILARARMIDPNIEIKPYRFGEREINFAARYAWPEHSPKRAWVQSGKVDPADAYDILCWAPPACSPDEFVSYLEHGLTAMVAGNETARHIGDMLTRIRSENQKASDERWNTVIDNAMELMDRHATLVCPDIITVAGAEIHNAPAKPLPKAVPKPERLRKRA